LPPAFSVAKPARIAFDFANTVNGLGKSSQTYNEGDLKSANIVQAEDRTRVVLNLNKPMTYEATIDGNSLLLALVPAPSRTARRRSSISPKGAAQRGRRTAFATSRSGAARMARGGSPLI
jgi:type IV pilus assembly protein PilQ